MSVSEEIRSLLNSSLNPYRLEVEDLSAEHAGHTGNPENKPEGTHIRIVLVSPQFSGNRKSNNIEWCIPFSNHGSIGVCIRLF